MLYIIEDILQELATNPAFHKYLIYFQLCPCVYLFVDICKWVLVPANARIFRLPELELQVVASHML